MARHLLAAFLVLAGLSGAGADPRQPDLLGITAGMLLPEAEALLERNGPFRRIRAVQRPRSGGAQRFDASMLFEAATGSDAVRRVTLYLTEGGRVFAMVLEVQREAERAPASRAVLSDLLRRFGPDPVVAVQIDTPARRDVIWAFGEDGARRPLRDGEAATCLFRAALFADDHAHGRDESEPLPPELAAPLTAAQARACGTMVTASLPLGPDAAALTVEQAILAPLIPLEEAPRR